MSVKEAQLELARREAARRGLDQAPQVAPQTQQGPPPTLFGGLSSLTGAAKQLPERLAGVAEFGQQLGSTAIGAPIAGIEGIIRGLAPGGMTGAEAVENRMQAMATQPQTQTGQAISGGFQNLMGGFDQKVSDFAASTGDPDDVLGATAVKTALLGVPSLFGARSLGSAKKPITGQQKILVEAQEQGYVTPTSSAIPTSTTRGAVEGFAGKPRMQQQASFQNQQVTNRLAARELGLADDAEITLDTLKRVRDEAGQAYNVLDNAGEIATSVTFRKDLANAVRDLRAASKDFPVLAKADSPVEGAILMAQGLNKPTFNASSVAPVTRILRDEASSAFRNGQAKVGQAYRDMSKALEDAAEAHLARVGDPQAVAAFQAARQRIAKSFSVEKALDGDGFVSAKKLASQRSRREPLTGGLDLAARFADQFPNSTRVIKEAPIQTGRLSGMIGAGGAGLGLGGEPLTGALIAASAFGGPAARAALLSKPGQRAFANPTGTTTLGVPNALAGILGSTAPLGDTFGLLTDKDQ